MQYPFLLPQKRNGKGRKASKPVKLTKTDMYTIYQFVRRNLNPSSPYEFTFDALGMDELNTGIFWRAVLNYAEMPIKASNIYSANRDFDAERFPQAVAYINYLSDTKAEFQWFMLLDDLLNGPLKAEIQILLYVLHIERTADGWRRSARQ